MTSLATANTNVPAEDREVDAAAIKKARGPVRRLVESTAWHDERSPGATNLTLRELVREGVATLARRGGLEPDEAAELAFQAAAAALDLPTGPRGVELAELAARFPGSAIVAGYARPDGFVFRVEADSSDDAVAALVRCGIPASRVLRVVLRPPAERATAAA